MSIESLGDVLPQSPGSARWVESVRQTMSATLACWWQDSSGENSLQWASESAEIDEVALRTVLTPLCSRVSGPPSVRPAPSELFPEHRLFLTRLSKQSHSGVLAVIREPFASTTEEIVWLKALRLLQGSGNVSTASEPTTAAGMAAAADMTASANLAVSGQSRLSRFHDSLDLSPTCSRIVNESLRLTSADRVTVLLRHGSRYRVAAVSGSSVVNRRSNLIRTMERLTALAMATGEPLYHPGDEDLPPQLENPLHEYLDESFACSAQILPLVPNVSCHRDDPEEMLRQTASSIETRGTPPIGAIVFEQMQGADPIPERPVLQLIAKEASVALQNALIYRQIFLRPLWSFLGGLLYGGRWIPKALILALAVALIVAATTIQVNHYVVATGALQPADQRHIFAGQEGVIETIHVQHGQRVEPGDVLITMRSAELDRQYEELQGELQTVSRRLAAVAAMRVSAANQPRDGTTPIDTLAGEQQQLESQHASLLRQHELLAQQISELQIRSPIGGHVIDFDLNRRLLSRPVARGHQLLTIGNLEGKWVAELVVPQRKVAVLFAAAERELESLPATCALATDPGRLYPCNVQRLGRSAWEDPAGKRLLDVVLAVDAISDETLHPGAELRAKIDCGERSFAASWLAEAADFVRMHLLFHFRRADR